MSEWLMWSTVNTFFRGSIPLGTYKNNTTIINTIYHFIPFYD